MEFWQWVTNQWDRATAIGAAALGALAILLGWLGVSRHGLPSQQIPYLASGAVFGLFLLGAGATLWLSADLRDEWRKLDEIQADIRAAVDERTVADGPETDLAATNGAAPTRATRARRPSTQA
jgi:hypothetical protein